MAASPPNLPPMLGFIDLNDQDGRILAVDQTAPTYVVRVTDHDGALKALPGYIHAAW